ncbi:glycosyltransferase family 4 protein [Fuerstiella marisgermanici]|uniref:D-inositol 3-phosphate glycosyltransferase n=1 Tax=Fuerstiella marisgermanici TaxID=1891926 RepID=A0A1P8WS83_9PLAN|nr:glycosyltransferase family 4 protein [Fuerstiella marisgermanici]APZ96915.1 D-inositol 3-phosphate glycosyltransferase [Fuerstiella marisgermanici]
MQPIALYFDQGGYVESTTVSAPNKSGGPAGLMGRQVAGKEFLDAYLRHGRWSETVALTAGSGADELLKEFCRTHPSSQSVQRRLRTFSAAKFHDEFLANPPARLLHFPNPPNPAYAWARQTNTPHRLAFSGVTHTLCTARAVEVLRGLVTDPWEEYDRLICTSTAVRRMVETVTDTFADYLQERHGGHPTSKIGLETIPLGVDTQKFRPATPSERRDQRAALQIEDDEVAVLFVGRLSHHAKAHPFPMFRAVAKAASAGSKRIRLLMCGWSHSDALAKAFHKTAAEIAPNVRIDFIDGLDSARRFGVWHAADIFLSLVDNIQETFGLVIVEAMASGLPVIASDWNGYRDLVVDGETGFRIPTWSVENTLPDLTSRLLIGEINYDHFLARSTQAVTVSSDAAAQALSALCEDSQLRTRLGRAGRQRAVAMFDWSHVIRQYEAMWQSQIEQLDAASKALSQAGHVPNFRQRPAAYPSVDVSFASYPTQWLNGSTRIKSKPDAVAELSSILSLSMMTHEPETRCTNGEVLTKVLRAAVEPQTLDQLSGVLAKAGVHEKKIRPTVAWLLKYDLLTPVA